MKRSAIKAEPITPAQYRAFQEADDFFNAELFAGSLPHVLVTLSYFLSNSCWAWLRWPRLIA